MNLLTKPQRTSASAQPARTNLFDVAGKTVLITGGAQGLGRMIAEGFIDAGASVIITSRKLEVAVEAAEEMGQRGTCHAFQADLGTTEGCETLTRAILDQHEQIHVLINNAGRTWGEPLEQFSDRGWSSVMPINLQAPFMMIRDLLPALKAAASDDDPARVINIGSIVGVVVEPLTAYSYAASKAAIHHLSRVLAAELAEFRITVNSVVPGYFPTNMTEYMRDDGEYAELTARVPLGRLGQSSDIVGACILLASKAGAYMTGSEVTIDGGMSGCR
ncbi:MAG: SDR family oxidoreductase [Sphingomonadales bacterium]|nr:MAG: SDR family oxidoreductase [Sphingomonadales bacterium]